MTSEEKQDTITHSEAPSNEIGNAFHIYSLLSEIVLLLGFVAGYSVITIKYWFTAWVAVEGLQFSFQFGESIMLLAFGLIGLSNSLFFIFLEFPKPTFILLIRLISLGICLAGIIILSMRILPPFSIGALFTLLLPVVSTLSIFIVKPLKKRRNVGKEATK